MDIDRSHSTGVVNSLLRCVREDHNAAPLFEAVEESPGLWVHEFEFPLLGSLDQWQVNVIEFFAAHRENLAVLRDSGEYCLYVCLATKTGIGPFAFDAALLEVLAAVGCRLEVVTATE